MNPTTRRHFLQHSSLAASATLLGFPAIVRSASPNSRLNLAFIGVGGRGGSNLKEVTKDGLNNVVALCDVNAQNLANAAKQFPGAKTFKDFRQLYADALKDIDAVVVSTTEHTHAFATMPALLAGKPVYCEKPLTHNVKEARAIMLAAQKAGVPTQMGTQIHSSPNYHRVVELIQSGAIGKVREAHVCVARAWGRQTAAEAAANKDIVHVEERPSMEMKAPDHLDWDLWIGPAPYRPYSDVYFPGPKWYRWWDFGNGTMSDLGSHWNDLPFWALKLDAPKSIEQVSGPAPHPEIAPATMSVRYDYAARGDMPACALYWHQGATKPEVWSSLPIFSKFSSGVLFIGDEGMLLSDYGKHVLLPEDKFKDFKAPAPFIPDSPGQQQQWLDAIKNGTPTGSPFATYAAQLTEANHLGNVAHRAGKKIEWDAVNMRFPNAPEAEKFLGREPRKGWSL